MQTVELWRRRVGHARAWPLLLLSIAVVWTAAVPARPGAELRHSKAVGTAPAGGLPLLPSGPEGPVPFGAYSTRLAYTPEWDRLWPVSEVADVVVRFGDAEPRFVFWRGTSYIPCWATQRGAWFTNEFFERRGGPASGTTSMVEPMSDKQCRYSSVRILENTDARVAVSGNRPSHTSLSQIKWQPYAEDRRSRTWIMMHGMSKIEAAQLVPLAASWLHPAELKVVRGAFTSSGYDAVQRAYILDNRSSGRASRLQLELSATGESPVVNPAFVIRNWGTANARLALDGRLVEQGSDFRVGHVSTLEGSDLVFWVRTRALRPVRLALSPK